MIFIYIPMVQAKKLTKIETNLMLKSAKIKSSHHLQEWKLSSYTGMEGDLQAAKELPLLTWTKDTEFLDAFLKLGAFGRV